MKSTQNSTNDAVSQNNQNMETNDVIKCDIALETGEAKAEVPEQEQIENTDALDLDDINESLYVFLIILLIFSFVL